MACILSRFCLYWKRFIERSRPLRMAINNRAIIDSAIDFSLYHGAIYCPNCGERIATRYITKMDKKEAYRFVPSAFNKRKAQT